MITSSYSFFPETLIEGAVYLYGINLRICGAFASSMMADWRRFRFLFRDFFVRM